MTLRPVLILGSEPRIAVPIARSLAGHGIPVDLAALSQNERDPRSRAVRNFVAAPAGAATLAESVSALIPYIQGQNIDMLIPTSDMALSLIAQHYESLSPFVHVACPRPDVLRRVLDKDATLDAARQCGIAVPKTYTITAETDVDDLMGNLRFPLVAKARSKSHVSSSAFKVRYFSDADAVKAQVRGDSQFGVDNLFQEFCPGDGVGLGVLFHRGVIIAAFQHRRLKEFPATGGVSVVAVSEPLDPELVSVSETLLRALNWDGVAMVEFRHDRARDRAVLMEVNGRYWGTCSFAIRCGINFPLYEWQLAHAERPSVPNSYPVGARWRWTSGYLRRMSRLLSDPSVQGIARPSAWSELSRLPADFNPSTVSALASRNDPLPAAYELFRTMIEVMKRHVKIGLRTLLPRRALHHRRIFHELGPRDRRVYLKLLLLRAFGMRLRRTETSRPIRRILFVCHGNIIRSPMAAALMKKQLGGFEGATVSISSAGLYATQGRGADSRALVAAREFGVSLDDHRAEQVTSELVRQADLIFVMDYINEAKLIGKYPEARHKVFLLCQYSKGRASQPSEVADPYKGSLDDIRHCYAILERSIRTLVMTDVFARS